VRWSAARKSRLRCRRRGSAPTTPEHSRADRERDRALEAGIEQIAWIVRIERGGSSDSGKVARVNNAASRIRLPQCDNHGDTVL